SSAFLLITSVWMVIDDYTAPWKNHQRDQQAIELERAEAELANEASLAIVANETARMAELEAVEAALEKRSGEIDALEEEVFQRKGELFVALEAAKTAKQLYNWEKFVVEEERLHKGDPTYGAEELEHLEQEMLDLAGGQQRAEIALAEKEAQLMELFSEKVAAEIAVKASAKALELVRKRKQALAPDDIGAQIAKIVRDDIPGLDFIGPNIKVQKVVLDDLTFELNFTKKTRIDMCKTCHQAIEMEGFEPGEVAEPHTSHPRLDMFLSATSPHPYTEVGCTICHRGAGEALDFGRIDHNVSKLFEPEKAERWEEEHHWHKKHYWDYPMLTSDKVEASCIQCHKDTMEIIADEAPVVSEGYQLFERYGCYACHKVEWFPTKRRPGPSLKNIFAKTDPAWVSAWIAKPAEFRPSTWMPQFFHLENWEEDQVVADSKYGEGREIMGGEWNDSAVAALTAFLSSRAPVEEFPAIPVEGNAQNGREQFRLRGCLACHNMEGFEGEELLTRDMAFDSDRYNESGPNLRGVATKVDAEWLFAWVKDPQAVWSETRMPNLRLSDQDAADITAYIMEDPDGVFTDVPDGWEKGMSDYDMEVLGEQARSYYSRTSRADLEKRLEGKDPMYRWDDPANLLVAVGEKMVQQYGCFSCHDIAGYEDANPIGTELTTWGSKTVDKLDWALLANQFQEERGWDQHQREEFKSYREHWARQKLHEPRSFDREKVKSPTERLKMPYFGFSEDQVEALVTFIVGLVDDEVQHAKMVPTYAQEQMDTGLRAIRQQNCVACHVIEPGTVTFLDEDGAQQTVEAELMSIDDFADANLHPIPPQTSMEDLNDYLAKYEEYLEEEVEDLGFRLLGTNGNVGQPGETIYVELDSLLDVTPAWGGDFVKLVTNYYYFGVDQFDAESDEHTSHWGSDEWAAVADIDGERRDYTDEFYPKLRWTFAPPVLWGEGSKLQKNWFYSFLVSPVSLREQMQVRMPTFNYPEGHAGAIADYFANQAVLDWPGEFAREFRYSQGQTFDELAEASGISADVLMKIEADDRPMITARFSELVDYATSVDHADFPAVNPDHQRIERRSPSYMANAHVTVGSDLARTGPKCFTCHIDNGTPPEAVPISWAPDLTHTRSRLLENWVVDWLRNPNLIYPGTSMPGNFLLEPAQYQEIFPDSTNEDQISAITDWLFNYERVPNN
ncbi:MAG: cytochrome c2, partial [Planctomycetota bacterium]